MPALLNKTGILIYKIENVYCLITLNLPDSTKFPF